MNGVPWSYACEGRGACESLHNEEVTAEAGSGVRAILSPPQRPGLSRQDNQGESHVRVALKHRPRLLMPGLVAALGSGESACWSLPCLPFSSVQLLSRVRLF